MVRFIPSSRYLGLIAEVARGKMANLILSNGLPLMPIRFDNLSLVLLNGSP